MDKVRISTEIEQREMTELKNIIIELKNSIEGFNNRQDHGEERIREFEDRALEFIQSEKQ